MHARLIICVFSAIVALLSVSGVEAASNLPAQSSTQAGVAVQATPRILDGSAWEFELAFNTHSRELTDDPAKEAVLVANGGAPSRPISWQGDPPGGHHRKGVLRFNSISPQPQAIELRIQRPGESAPRSFRWQLK